VVTDRHAKHLQTDVSHLIYPEIWLLKVLNRVISTVVSYVQLLFLVSVSACLLIQQYLIIKILLHLVQYLPHRKRLLCRVRGRFLAVVQAFLRGLVTDDDAVAASVFT